MKVLVGVFLTKNVKEKSDDKTLYVEVHKCDQCGGEYKVYLKSALIVEDAFQQLAKRMGNLSHQKDLCLDCQTRVILNQPMLPLEV